MGASISKLFSGLIWGKKDIRILILGLVSAIAGRCQALLLISEIGQCRQNYSALQVKGTHNAAHIQATRLTRHDKIGEVVTTIPTIGFNVE
jgi:ADP-ribosylation factor-like protein 1